MPRGGGSDTLRTTNAGLYLASDGRPLRAVGH
jgi:hypothetical protein